MSYPLWTGNPEKTAYLFYQGIGDTQTQAVRYIGKQTLGTSTREIIYSVPEGIVAFPRERLWLYPELDDINREPKWGGISLAAQWNRGISSIKAPNTPLTYRPLYPQDESGSVHRYGLYLNKSSFGQKRDIDSHQKRYDTLMDPSIRAGDAPQNVVLYGVSRGAATTYAALATHKNQYQNVKLCVLEAPPATMSATLKAFFGRTIGKALYQKQVASFFFGEEHLPEKEKQAIAYVDQFPDHIPLVIITSIDDGVVPHKSSLNLALRTAAKRIQRQQNNTTPSPDIAPVYLIQLDKSGHNGSSHNPKDRYRYQTGLHAIYKKHGLPYIEAYARAGNNELNSADLTQGELANQVMYQHQFKQSTDRATRDTIRKTALAHLTAAPWPHDKNSHCRMLKLCKEMPLFAKYPSAFSKKTKAQSTIDHFSKAHLKSTDVQAGLFSPKQKKHLRKIGGLVVAAGIISIMLLYTSPIITGISLFTLALGVALLGSILHLWKKHYSERKATLQQEDINPSDVVACP